MSYKGEQDEPTEDRGVGYPVAYSFISIPGGAEKVLCESLIPDRDFLFFPSSVGARPLGGDGMLLVRAQGKSIAEAQQNMRHFANANNLPIWA